MGNKLKFRQKNSRWKSHDAEDENGNRKKATR